jgi:hypothetical protein
MAHLQRQTPTTDAAIELTAKSLQQRDPSIQLHSPIYRKSLPVLGGGRATARQGINSLPNHGQWQAQALRNFNNRNAPENVSTVTALIPGAPPALDQTLRFIEVDS